MKVDNAAGQMSISDILKGYDYLAEICIEANIKAINNSWGSPIVSTAVSLAVTRLGELGALSTFAAGNDAENVDTNIDSSAFLGNPYAVTIDSSTNAAQLSSFSNYGVNTTDIAAPGTQILSTVPLSLSTYLPEAVVDNVSYESFDKEGTGESPTVRFYSDYASAAASDSESAIGFSSSEIHYDTCSWGIQVEKMEHPQLVSTNDWRSCYMTIPVAEGQRADAQYFGLKTYIPDITATTGVRIEIDALDKDGNHVWVPTRSYGILYGPEEWGVEEADLGTLEQETGCSIAYTESDQMVLRINLVRVNGVLTSADTLYIDSVGVGKSLVPYEYMDGTSMATPMATGAAAVLAAEESVATDDEERAAAARQRAARLSGSVTYPETNAFEDTCVSGGSLDLAERDNPIPVLSGAIVEDTRLLISGYFFGGGTGTVTVGGTAADVVSWGETSIEIICPEDVASGIVDISVTNDTFQVGRRSFLLEISADITTPLFEESLQFPDDPDFPKSSLATASLTGLGGNLYLIPLDILNKDGDYASMWRYDLQTRV